MKYFRQFYVHFAGNMNGDPPPSVVFPVHQSTSL